MRLGSKLLGEGRVGIYASRTTKAYLIDSRLGVLIVRILEGKHYARETLLVGC